MISTKTCEPKNMGTRHSCRQSDNIVKWRQWFFYYTSSNNLFEVWTALPFFWKNTFLQRKGLILGLFIVIIEHDRNNKTTVHSISDYMHKCTRAVHCIERFEQNTMDKSAIPWSRIVWDDGELSSIRSANHLIGYNKEEDHEKKKHLQGWCTDIARLLSSPTIANFFTHVFLSCRFPFQVRITIIFMKCVIPIR